VYPESHGCVHLPSEFAKELFAISPAGMTVVIADAATEPTWVTHPGYLAPVSVTGGKPIEDDPLTSSEEERWDPEVATSGPVSIVLSRQSRCMVVYRNGIEIGRAKIVVTGEQPFATHALVLAAGPSDIPDPYVPDATKYHWLRIGVPGHMGEAGGDPDPATIARIQIPLEFVKEVSSVLTPGATVIVTDQAMSPGTSGPLLQVVDADPPARKKPAKS
jgi:hypothetical protein